MLDYTVQLTIWLPIKDMVGTVDRYVKYDIPLKEKKLGILLQGNKKLLVKLVGITTSLTNK